MIACVKRIRSPATVMYCSSWGCMKCCSTIQIYIFIKYNFYVTYVLERLCFYVLSKYRYHSVKCWCCFDMFFNSCIHIGCTIFLQIELFQNFYPHHSTMALYIEVNLYHFSSRSIFNTLHRGLSSPLFIKVSLPHSSSKSIFTTFHRGVFSTIHRSLSLPHSIESIFATLHWSLLLPLSHEVNL